MDRIGDFNLRTIDYLTLSLDERERVKAQAVRRAHVERAMMLRKISRWVFDPQFLRPELAPRRFWGVCAKSHIPGPPCLISPAVNSMEPIMTPDQKTLVQRTWLQVVPMAEAASELFYHRLFQIDPALHQLFKATDMAAQREKLMYTLGVAVRGLDDLETLLPAIEDLGRRHVGYGVTDAHYDTVGAALLWTLEKGLGEAWTPEVADAWAAAYGTLSGVMREAA